MWPVKTVAMFLLCLPMMAVSQIRPAETPSFALLQGLGDVSYLSLSRTRSDKQVQQYHVFVRLPESYDGERQYPAVYLLDGGVNFPLLAAYYRLLRISDDFPDLILVGIGYGTDDWRKGNGRSHDYTLPGDDRPHWGGARDFESFLLEQLFPAVEASVAADPDQRILFGQSLGGQFGLYSVMYGKAPFAAVIASNPALHANLERFTQPVITRSNTPLLFVSAAEFDAARFCEPLQRWSAHWAGQLSTPHWYMTRLAGHTHLSANPEAFRQGIQWIMQQWQEKHEVKGLKQKKPVN